MPWNPIDYAKHSSAQLGWGRELIARLDLRGDEAILDVGCGDGKITAELAAAAPRGFVLGVDANPDFINYAQQHYPPAKYPNLQFRQMDARRLVVERQFNVVFSNAVLHWVQDHRAFLQGCAQLLRTGGRLMISCGGAGNMREVVTALNRVIIHPPDHRSVSNPTPAGFLGALSCPGSAARSRGHEDLISRFSR